MYPVQPIAVKPSTHFETVSAVAIASNLMFAGADHSSEPWATWLKQSYGKNVRNIRRPAEALRLATMEGDRVEFTVGQATAYAFMPMGYTAFPSPLKKLQVTGLELPRTETVYGVPGDVIPRIVIGEHVPMSTGKTAAQVSHGLMLWMLEQDSATIRRWSRAPGLSLHIADLGTVCEPSVTVVDNGHTELAPNTATVRVALDTP